MAIAVFYDVFRLGSVLSLMASMLSDDNLEKARKELNEDQETRNTVIEELRRRITERECCNEPQLNGVVFGNKENSFLLQFLRARKFDVERALQLYINYYTNRRDHPKIFNEYTPESVRDILQSGLFSVMDGDHTTKMGAKIVCVRVINWNMDTQPFEHVIKAMVLIMEKLLEDETTQINGLSVFESFEGVSFGHMCRLASYEASFRGVIVSLLQDGLPIRLKSAHMLFQPFYINMLMMLVWPFMKEKLRQRIHLHGYDMTSLHEYVDPVHLPHEFQGSLPSIDEFTAARLFHFNEGTEV